MEHPVRKQFREDVRLAGLTENSRAALDLDLVQEPGMGVREKDDGSASAVGATLKDAVKLIGIYNVTPHVFRHSFATRMLDAKSHAMSPLWRTTTGMGAGIATPKKPEPIIQPLRHTTPSHLSPIAPRGDASAPPRRRNHENSAGKQHHAKTQTSSQPGDFGSPGYSITPFCHGAFSPTGFSYRLRDTKNHIRCLILTVLVATIIFEPSCTKTRIKVLLRWERHV